jgi:beta-1,4-mannooligosaccharide/beta-1,4-mannosyl-N-acetylglucosamine phosphorylase
MGAAILDKDNPAIVKHRTRSFILTPEEDYEERGFVPNVVFPCAALTDAESGKIAIYYGCADTYVGLAFTTVDELVDYILANDANTGDDDKDGIM